MSLMFSVQCSIALPQKEHPKFLRIQLFGKLMSQFNALLTEMKATKIILRCDLKSKMENIHQVLNTKEI